MIFSCNDKQLLPSSSVNQIKLIKGKGMVFLPLLEEDLDMVPRSHTNCFLSTVDIYLFYTVYHRAGWRVRWATLFFFCTKSRRRLLTHADHQISIGFVALSFCQVLISLCKEISKVMMCVTRLPPSPPCSSFLVASLLWTYPDTGLLTHYTAFLSLQPPEWGT
jgi:hypothetical protein